MRRQTVHSAQARPPLGLDARGRLEVPAPPPRVGIVRGMAHTYEASEWTPWGSVSNVPAAGWERGQIIRGSQPVFALTPHYPAWDRSDPSWWASQRG